METDAADGRFAVVAAEEGRHVFDARDDSTGIIEPASMGHPLHDVGWA
jgi:hypothetical protein